MSARLAASLLLAAVPALAQAPRAPQFERDLAGIAPAALPGASDLLSQLDSASDQARRLDALNQISLRAASFPGSEQVALAEGLRAAVLSADSSVELRWKGLEALSRAAPAFTSAEASRKAVATLGVLSLPGGAYPELKAPALLSLARAMGRLSWLDRETEENILRTAVEGLRAGRAPDERAAALLLFRDYLESRGIAPLTRSPELAAGLGRVLIAPLEESLEPLYGAPGLRREDRHVLIRVLGLVGRTDGGDHELALRARRLLFKVSAREPEPRLKGLAGLYAKGLKP